MESLHLCGNLVGLTTRVNGRTVLFLANKNLNNKSKQYKIINNLAFTQSHHWIQNKCDCFWSNKNARPQMVGVQLIHFTNTNSQMCFECNELNYFMTVSLLNFNIN